MILTKESLYLKAATFDELLSNDFESVPAQKNETELGAKRLAAWCHAASGGDWNLFSKRLKRDNLKYNYVLTRFSSAKISQKIKYPQWVKDSLWIQSLYQNQGLIQKKVLFSTKQITLPFENIFFNLRTLFLTRSRSSFVFLRRVLISDNFCVAGTMLKFFIEV